VGRERVLARPVELELLFLGVEQIDHPWVAGPQQAGGLALQAIATGLGECHLAHDGPLRSGDHVDPVM